MRFKITIATLAALLTAGSLSAQETSPSQSKAKVAQSNPSPSVDNRLSKEQILAKCLTITNQEMVAIASFAEGKSTNEDVKALALTLEKAHKECLEELKGIANKAATGKKSPPTSSPVVNSNANEVDFLQIHQEISDQCLKDSKEMLSKKAGNDFDSCFVGMQIAKHGMMHSSLSVLQRHTTGELQVFIKASLVKNDEHMKAATDLMERLTDISVIKTATAAK
jgi:predicted outer membrane protein